MFGLSFNNLIFLIIIKTQQIEKVCIAGCDLHWNDPTASRDLAKFLCFLPCLTDLTIKEYVKPMEIIYFHDNFYYELARLATSSKVIYNVF